MSRYPNIPSRHLLWLLHFPPFFLFPPLPSLHLLFSILSPSFSVHPELLHLSSFLSYSFLIGFRHLFMCSPFSSSLLFYLSFLLLAPPRHPSPLPGKGTAASPDNVPIVIHAPKWLIITEAFARSVLEKPSWLMNSRRA